MNVDLKKPGMLKLIASKIKADIDNYCLSYDDGNRKHLGASLIGRKCKRYLWYVFRWAVTKKFDGRMLRLFNRGHREEERFIEWLEGCGFIVTTRQPEILHWHAESDSYFIDKVFDVGDGLVNDVTGNKMHEAIAASRGVKYENHQIRISGCGGHFGGSLDGECYFPKSYGIEEKFLLEFKTNGTGPNFVKLVENGFAKEKLEHWAQTCTYGFKKKIKYCIYLNICKNDDNIHCEVVELDWNLGEQMFNKAEQIITSQEPPPRLSDNPTYYECKYCDAYNVCHGGEALPKNCRSCINAKPVDNGEWFCQQWGANIPADAIAVGCPEWKTINVV